MIFSSDIKPCGVAQDVRPSARRTVCPCLLPGKLVERQAAVAADVELVNGPLAVLGDEEADDFRNLFRLDELRRIDVRRS